MKENSSKLDTVLRIIIFTGVILDTYSVYGIWKQLNDKEIINSALTKNGLDPSDMNLIQMLSNIQSVATVLLAGFLIFDFFAYYNLFEYKNWARKYILSIAVFYLIGCLFQFSSLYFVYSIGTIYFLWKPHKVFLKS